MTITTNQEYPLTSEFYIKSKTGDTKSPLLVFIPGNPGLIDYYTTYLGLISESYPAYDIWAISHAGYQTSGEYVKDGDADSTFYDLEYQIDHKHKLIKQKVLGGHTHLSFLCHSVGGYITQRVVKRLLADEELKDIVEVDFIGLVCPTVVDIAKSESGVIFSRLFMFLPVVQLALISLAVLQILISDATARKIIGKYIIARPVLNTARSIESWNNAVEATFKIYKSKKITRQALTLAKEELRVIHRDDRINDWFFEELPGAHNVKLWCFFAPSDYWVHDNTRDYLLSRYHDSENKLLTFEVGSPTQGQNRAITHSFCIDQSVEFAEITCDALRPVMH